MAGVGLADFCYKPNPWVQHILKDRVPAEVTSYYLMCNRMSQSPFATDMAVSSKTLTINTQGCIKLKVLS